MSKQQFNDIMRRIHNLDTSGMPDEQAFDMALFILDDNPDLEEYIQNKIGARDAVGWLMHRL